MYSKNIKVCTGTSGNPAPDAKSSARRYFCSASWLVHDTLLKNYTTKITARNVLGQESHAYAEWSDPSAYNISINLNPNPANPGQNVAVSGLVVNATSGTALANNSLSIFLDGQAINVTNPGNWTPKGESQALWQYRRAITINGSTSLLNNYQILVNLTSSNFNFSRANPQGNDTRFTWLNTTNGLEQNISFGIESWNTTTQNALLWVKVPNVTASNVANTTLYMYYGNPGASSASNGANTFLFFDDFTGSSIDAAKWSQTGTLSGTDHGGADWTPANGASIDGVHYNIGTFTIAAGTTVYVTAYNGTTYGRLQVYANAANIAGTLSADGSGYAAASGPGAGGSGTPNYGTGGGGGYGGVGGSGNYGGGGGVSYGSITAPTDLGSGGGDNSCYYGCVYGGAGGGLVKLNVNGATTINGLITANGNAGNAGAGTGGGGSGGTIYISTGTLSGNGVIAANGGVGVQSGAYFSGGGAGGRIAVYYTTSTYTGTTAVTGGTGNVAGGAGTIYQGAYPFWSVAGSELKGMNTIGRLKSISTFSSGVILETKSRYVSLPTNGYQVAGFYSSSSGALGYLNNPTADYYRNDASWVLIAATAPASTNLLTKIAVKSASAVDLSVTNYNTGASYQSALNILNSVSGEPITLGQRYDDVNAGQAYEAYWDWVRVRSYAPPEPSMISIGAEQTTTTTNSTGGYNNTFAAPQTAGSHTVLVNLTDPNGIVGTNTTSLSVRINLTSPGSKGIATGTAYANANESVNLSVNIPASNINYPTLNLSTVWSVAQKTNNTGLVGWWKLDEGAGTTTADSSGNGNTGTLNGGAVWTSSGKYGNALTFDGASGYVNAGSGASLNITNAITISAWVKPLSFPSVSIILSKYSGVSGGYKLGLFGNNPQFTNYNLWDDTATGTIPLNTWTNVVVTYDLQNVKFYINGILDTTHSRTDVIGANTANVFIGYDIGTRFFNGTIDEVRIYNRSLSAQEIADLYNATQTKFLSGSVSGGTWWNASTYPLGSYDVSFYANLTDGFSITTAASAAFNVKQLNITYSINKTAIYATDSALINGTIYREPEHGASVNTLMNISVSGGTFDKIADAASMKGYWAFDENNSASEKDSSGNGNTGTYYGETFNNGTLTNFTFDSTDGWTAGNISGGLKFDGAKDYVNIPSTSLGGFNGTIEAWIKLTSFGGANCNLHNGLTACKVIVFSDDYGYMFGVNNDGALILDMASNGTGPWSTIHNTQPGLISLNAWYHVAITTGDGGNNIKYYVNGQLKNSSTVSTYVGLKMGSNNRIGIGGSALQPTSFPFNGTIDEVRIYNRSLSAAEINATYVNNTFIRDGLVSNWRFDEGAGTTAYDTHHIATPDNLNGTKFGNALTFNGVGDYVNAGNSSALNGITSTLTIQAWIKPGVQGNYGLTGIVTKRPMQGTGSDTDTQWDMRWEFGNLTFHWFNGGWKDVKGCTNLNLSINQWIHVAVTRASTNSIPKLFVNGQEDSICYSIDPTASFVSYPNTPVYVGLDWNGYFNGSIDDVRIYNRALSAQEITLLYQLGPAAHIVTNSTGGYSTVYTPNASITAVTNISVNFGATDSDGINGTITNSSAIRVYPAISVNVTTNQSWYDIGQTINATATVFYGSSLDNSEAQVQFVVLKDGYRYPSNVSVNTSAWLSTSGSTVSYQYTFNESGKYYVTVTAKNPVVNSAITVSAASNYTAGRLNTTINTNRSIIYANGNALVSGTVYDWLNGGWVRNTSMTSATWWNTSWQSRKAITINGSTSAQANYQVNLIINSSNVGGSFNWSTYGNDTRFTWLNTTSNAEQNVSFWLEYWNNATAGNNASIWVKVPNVTASSVANTTLYMYYGNPGATYNNSLGGSNTFVRVINNVTAAYDFNEGSGTTTADSSGNGLTGTLVSPTWVKGRIGYALKFGSNIYGSMNQQFSPDINAVYAVVIWFNDSATGNGRYVDIGNSTDRNVMFMTAAGSLDVETDSRNGMQTAVGIYTANAWHSAIWVHNPGQYLSTTAYSMYLDGVQQTVTTSSGNTNPYPLISGNQLGTEPSFCCGNYYADNNGQLDSVRIINGNLTQAEIADLGNSSYTDLVSANKSYVRSYASPEPSVLSIGSQETQAGATVSLSATGGTILSNVSTNSTGGYSATYTPPSITSIQTYTITANATDSDTLNSSTVSTQIKVYPALSKLNASIYTDRTYYNIGENVTIGAVMRNNESALFTGALLQAKIYRNDTGALIGTVNLPEQASFFTGSYLANFSTAGLTDGWHYINLTSEVDGYVAPIAGSGKLFYANNFSPVLQATNSSGFEKYNFGHKEKILFRISNAGSPTTYGTVALNDSKAVPRYNETRSSGTTTISGYSYTMPNRVNGSYWLALANVTDSTSKKPLREAKIFARYEWWDRDVTNPDMWEHRVRIALDNGLGPAQANVLVRVNGSELSAAGVNITSIKAGSIRVIDPDASPVSNEVNGHPVAYNITSTSSFGSQDNVTFYANISENSIKTYYIYFSYLDGTMITTSSAMQAAGTSFAHALDSMDNADLAISMIKTDKELYDFGDTVYFNISLYTPDHSTNTVVGTEFFNSSGTSLCDNAGGWLCLSPVEPGDPDNDYVWSGSVAITDDKYYRGYGLWTLNATATAGTSSDVMQKQITVEGTNATINAPAYIYANDSLTVSGNVTYKTSGLNATGANLTIYVEKPAGAIMAQRIMNADGNGSYAYTFIAMNISGDFQIRVASNHSLPLGIAKGTNTQALEIRHKADQYAIAPAKSWFPEENVWINTTAKTYSDAGALAENLALTINITNSSGNSVSVISDNIAFATAFANKTIEDIWNMSGRPADVYNVTATLASQNIYDNAVKQVNQTMFKFYRLNVTVNTSVQSLMTGQWVNITGTIAYPNGTVRDCAPVYISIRGINDANGLPWSKNITKNSAGGMFDNYTIADIPGTLMVYATCYGTNEKGYGTAPLQINLSAGVNIIADAPSYKANTPVYINVTVNNTAQTTVNNYLVAARIVNSTGAAIDYPSPQAWTISSIGPLAQNLTQIAWNTASWAPDNYTVIADVNVSGKKVGSGNTTFRVNATIEVKSFSLGLNTTLLGLGNDLGISGWINRTGNVPVNGTLDIYIKDYTGAKILGSSYPGKASSPGKDYARIFNTTAYQNSPANFTNNVQYNYSALWNSWYFHNGTYTVVGNFTYYDEYGAPKSINDSKAATIQPVRSARVWFAEPPNGTAYGSGQKFNASVYLQNTGNIELCAVSGVCKSWVQSIITDGTNPHWIDENSTYFLSTGILDFMPLVSQDIYIDPSTGTSNNHPGGFNPNNDLFYAGTHAITANFTYDGGVAYNSSYIIIPPIDANITLNPYSISPVPPNYPAYKDVAFSPQWSVGGNIKRYNLTEKIEAILQGTGIQNILNKTYDLAPGVSTLQIINWNTLQYPNGSYLARIKLYNSTGQQVNFVYSGSLVSQTDLLFTILPTNNATVSINTANTSYNAYADVNITGFVNNTGNVPNITGYLNLTIFGPSGFYDNLSSCGNATFPVNNNYSCTWNTGIYQNGTYSVNATYSFGSGTASASKIFVINPYGRANASTGTDNSAYSQSQVVNISANITNTGNMPITGNLTIRIKYGGSAVATVNQTNGISVPVAGMHASWGTTWNTANSQYGSYDVVSDFAYLDENSTVRTATGTRTITVNENRTLTWSMNTNSDSYKSNQGVNITVNLNNTGNAVLYSTTLVYNIMQGATVIAAYTDSIGTVSIGSAYTRNWVWNTSQYAPGTYTVNVTASDSSPKSWMISKSIQINATKTASIAGLAVDVMPPSNYSLGQTISAYGTANATGNVQFAGNLSLGYYNSRLGQIRAYNNYTGVSTPFGMYPSSTASSTAIDIGVINLTATFTWIDEDNVKRTAWVNVTFYVGGTSVSVNTGSTNTYSPDDAIPLYVNVSGIGGPIAGLTSGNFTITDGTGNYAPAMQDMGGGQYKFTFARNALPIRDYLMRATVTDPATNIPGTGTTNLYVRDHWITVRVNANSAISSPVTDAGRGYSSAIMGPVFVAIVQRGGTLDSVSSSPNNLVMKQKLSANRFNIVATKSEAKDNLKDRINLINSGEFEKYASPSFGYALTRDYHVSVSRVYDAIDIVGVDVGAFRPGMYNLVIRNDGASNGKTRIIISRK